MRRFVAATVLALGLLLAPPVAAQTAIEDSVSGSGGGGFTSIGRFSFQIDAHSGPNGENPTGTASFTPIQFGTFQGPVLCLVVDGNAATLNFAVFDPQSGPHVFTFTAIDSPAGDQFDFGVDVRAPTDCSPLNSLEPITFGNIVVVDAVPLPTRTDQCKNGGWRTYGVFKNQGDCVSFVATGGKNPPAGSP